MRCAVSFVLMARSIRVTCSEVGGHGVEPSVLGSVLFSVSGLGPALNLALAGLRCGH